MRFRSSYALAFSILLLLGAFPAPAQDALIPWTREAAVPDGGAVARNPPALLWPAGSGGAHYTAELSQDPGFPIANTQRLESEWAMANPHRALDAGTWYWRYETKAQGKSEQSKTFTFTVAADTRGFVTPPAAAMLAAVPDGHPRVLVPAHELEAFRARAQGMHEAERIVSSARREIGGRMPTEDAGKPQEKGATKKQNNDFAKWASKGLAGGFAGGVRELCMAYCITGDAAFAGEIKRRALHIAGWDPNGVTAPNVSDFADGSCLEALALAYDTCHAEFSPAERATLQKAIKARASRMYGKWANNLETKIFNAHVWQHIMAQFWDAALATSREIPEAEQWAAYVYELWVNRIPAMGGDDGGWANGSNYFATNFKTLCEMPATFRELTGVDFFDLAWYRNAPYYMMYVWPPDSASAGFGDGAERQTSGAGTNWFAFADVLAREAKDPVAAWYVNAGLDGKLDRIAGDSSLAWFRLRHYGESKPIAPAKTFDLPQARVFQDIGVASLHTDLAHAESDLMLTLRSSPYGSVNHAHCNQNEFTLNFGGERMFCSTGYYIAYGDPHYRGWYKDTRGHNAVLINGEGQRFDSTEGYGQIVDFGDTGTVAWSTGDASHAYPKDAGLKRWRRTVALLRPGTVVVYDDLEAKQPVDWQWLLHSNDKFHYSEGKGVYNVSNARGHALFYIRASAPAKEDWNNVFNPPADNWRGKEDSDGKVAQYPNQWHLTLQPREKVAALRVLTVAQLFDRSASVRTPEMIGQGWTIEGELDPAKPAMLTLGRKNGERVVMDTKGAQR